MLELGDRVTLVVTVAVARKTELSITKCSIAILHVNTQINSYHFSYNLY